MPAFPKLPTYPAASPLFRSAALRQAPTNRKPGWRDKPVLVTSDHDQWYAVVGLPLDMTPGSHELSVKIGSEMKAESFTVNPKKYPEQRITLKDKSKVELSAADLARAEREIAAIKELKLHWRAAQDTDLEFIVPAEGQAGQPLRTAPVLQRGSRARRMPASMWR